MKLSGARLEWIIMAYLLAFCGFMLAGAFKLLPEWVLASVGLLFIPILIALLAAPFLVAYNIYASIRDRRADKAPAKQD